MRIVIVAESFLPQTNGVVHSVLRVLDHLAARGDDVLVVAPDAGPDVPATVAGARVVTVPAWSFPGYADVRVATGRVSPLTAILRDFGPDVVHLASPFALGWRAALAAAALDLPVVAVYQTDVPTYAGRYGVRGVETLLWKRVRDLHGRADLTLAPSTATIRTLEERGVDRLRLWRRGVDTDRFSPTRRDETWRRELAPAGERLVGYVGRLAPEKQVQDLAALQHQAGIRLVVVGDGPERTRLERLLPGAHFTGMLHGSALATAVASLDVLVSTSETETFCQVVQEGLASGVPVVAAGVGGPVDLVDHSRTGWLYEPGDLADLAERVRDLTGDDAKRAAFGRAARRSVEGRSWQAVCSELVGHYAAAIEQHRGTGPHDIGRLHWTTRRMVRS
ncbi:MULTISPECIES: glycosyltransferase family 1 protein [unclassified Aeromicrobium]|uniref:glycosyltransferase family 4 protein n=1 Tax=unclassified Aeromicrobium TaxID=2633570 RepID=UPI0006FD9C10|nr:MULTISPECIES: glycosyltransferase family 1 protein [unclassified Aeromicrobium]KQP24935.1 alpha-mannosyltransferase [Aeromicrobium sp. Leaf272]KQP79562.1 alpha-mannosyltransferase [Aeromicrobium sp. Leaf289]